MTFKSISAFWKEVWYFVTGSEVVDFPPYWKGMVEGEGEEPKRAPRVTDPPSPEMLAEIAKRHRKEPSYIPPPGGAIPIMDMDSEIGTFTTDKRPTDSPSPPDVTATNNPWFPRQGPSQVGPAPVSVTTSAPVVSELQQRTTQEAIEAEAAFFKYGYHQGWCDRIIKGTPKGDGIELGEVPCNCGFQITYDHIRGSG